MTTHELVVQEEREAKARLRAARRLQREAERARTRQWRARLRSALQAAPAHGCRCGLSPRMSREDLRALGAGCTGPTFVCPRLDTIRRRLGL